MSKAQWVHKNAYHKHFDTQSLSTLVSDANSLLICIFMHPLSFGHPEPYQEKQVDDYRPYLAVGPALQILQLNVEGLSTAKTKLECGLTILRY